MLAVNTLVRSKSGKFKGIGCIAKTFVKQANVNHGTQDVMKVSYSDLVPLDLHALGAIPPRSFADYRDRIMMPERLSGFNDCIVGNVKHHFVGICWISEREVTEEDLKRYPRIVD